MWKRWSIKSLTGETAIEAKAKQQTSVTAEPSDRESLGIGLKADSTIQEAALDSQEEMDKGHVIPIQLPTPKNSAEDTIEQPIAPVRSTEISSQEALGSVALDPHVPPGVTTLPFPTPHTETAEQPLTPTLKPSPVNARHTSADIPGNVVDTHTFSNTLSASSPELPSLPTRGRRLSFRSLAFFYGRDKQPLFIPELPTQEHSMRRIQTRTKLSRSQKEALSSAMTLRTIMLGLDSSKPSSTGNSILHLGGNFSRHFSPTFSSPLPNLKKVKAQLLKPESANAIISYLRRLPLPDGPSFHLPGRASSESLVTHPDTGGGPIHAVCLACTDEEAEKVHFSRLRTGHTLSPTSPDLLSAPSSSSPPNIATASLESLIPVLRDLRLVSLLTSPDLGFGQPVSDEKDIGIFTGSIPSPAVLVDGFEEITTQLMNLGFATSKAIAPSHAGIYPPEDRMSCLTCEWPCLQHFHFESQITIDWWGLELVLPEPSVQYLGVCS